MAVVRPATKTAPAAKAAPAKATVKTVESIEVTIGFDHPTPNYKVYGAVWKTADGKKAKFVPTLHMSEDTVKSLGLTDADSVVITVRKAPKA